MIFVHHPIFDKSGFRYLLQKKQQEMSTIYENTNNWYYY